MLPRFVCLRYLCLIGAAALISGSILRAETPVLNAINPRGGQRGTDAVLTFSGARLGDAKEVVPFYPGITVTKLEVVNDGQLKVAVKIAPDCRMGEHVFRVRCGSGISDMRTYWVGALPSVDEKEPNNDFANPQKVPFNITVHGVAENEDVDYFAVDVKKGQRISAEVIGMRLGGAMCDPYVAILDSKRFELARSDDAALLGQDGCISIIAPTDGSYIIQVRESSYRGNGGCQYLCHIGGFPRPTSISPTGGKFGEEIEVTMFGDPAGPIKQKVKLPATMPEAPFGIDAVDAGGITPTPFRFRLSEFGNLNEVEPNDAIAQATPGSIAPLAFNGIIDKPGDVDQFRFTAKKGEVYDIHCYARRIGSALDPVMYLSNGTGGDLVGNDDAVGPDSFFRFTVPEDKEYVIRVTDHLGKGGPNYFYRIEMQPARPKLTVTIPKVDFFGYSQERQTIAVPKGNRWAVLVTASRADFGGDLTLGANGLPAGITTAADTMPANLNQTPMVFEAAPTAAVGGSLGTITAAPTDPNLKIASIYEQIVYLVAVPNQGVYWRHDLPKASFAVAEEVPFKINVIEPKVPLVQGGSMQIKVVAERKAGFKAPITVYPLFNPPGVGSSTAVTIPEGQTEVMFSVNAAGNAQVRKWKTALVASSDAGKGPIWVSSQLFTLDVAAPFVAITMERTATEQGKPTQLFCKMTTTTPFPGNARVQLIGLPAKTTAPIVEVNKDAKEFHFAIAAEPTAPAGTHKNLFCQVIITMNGEPIIHNMGYSELRIDVPLPPKVNAPAAPPTVAKPAVPTPPPANQPPPKRLTRLEQLRLEQEEREKALKNNPPEKK